MVFLIIFRYKKSYIQIIRHIIEKRVLRKVIDKGIQDYNYSIKKYSISFQLHWKQK